MCPSLKSDSILDHKSSLTYYRGIEIIFSTLSDHRGIKLEWTFTNHWRNQVFSKPALKKLILAACITMPKIIPYWQTYEMSLSCD